MIALKGDDIPNVFVEPTKDGQYQIEFAGHTPTADRSKHSKRRDQAKCMGHHPLVARVRHLNDKKTPDHWRAA